MSPNLRIGVAIPAYRDPDRLRCCLNAIAAIDREWLSSVTVVDDSGDGAVAEALHDEFNQVNWIVEGTNRGFIPTANRAVRECNADIVLLLNDDVELRRDPRTRALELFNSTRLFALSLRSVTVTGQTREGAKRIVWRFGIARVLHNEKDQKPLSNDCSPTDYAVGGHALFRREVFLELGGFDSLFQPFYWEDADLSARAEARGLQVLYLADSEVFHNDIGAIKTTHAESSIRRTVLRNRLLYSYRHAFGAQRLLLPLAITYKRIVAAFRGDTTMAAAIQDYYTSRRS